MEKLHGLINFWSTSKECLIFLNKNYQKCYFKWLNVGFFCFLAHIDTIHNIARKYRQHFSSKGSRFKLINTWYSTVLRWIWNLFHEWDWIFYISTTAKHEWKYYKIMFHEWNKFHIQRQTIGFSVYHVFLWFLTCFALHTLHDLTSQLLVIIPLLIFSH